VGSVEHDDSCLLVESLSENIQVKLEGLSLELERDTSNLSSSKLEMTNVLWEERFDDDDFISRSQKSLAHHIEG